MQINLIVQKNNKNTLYQSFSNNLENAKKVYIVSGSVKESGFELLEECLIDTKIKSYFFIGIDKKNTTKNMLESMLKLSKEVYCYNNNLEVEFDSNVIIIEEAKLARMYVFSSNLSDLSMNENISLYTEIVFDLLKSDDKTEYKNKVKEILNFINDENFFLLSNEMISDLIENKEIFSTKQYNHSVMSISELLNKKSEKLSVENTAISEEIKDVEIPKIDLSDIDLDIELPDIDKEKINDEPKEEIKIELSKCDEIYENTQNEEIESLEFDQNESMQIEGENYFNSEDTLDINNLLFEKADIKLEKQDEKKDDVIKNEEKLEVKKLNLNNISNLILELPARPSKGKDLKNIKVPNYIKQMIPDFFCLNSNAKSESIDGNMYKYRDINIEIIVAKTGEKFTDRQAKLMQKQGQTYITFTTSAFENVDYSEGDILRIIKLSDEIYHIEVISSDMSEYKIWSKVCNQKMKSSERKYGMM